MPKKTTVSIPLDVIKALRIYMIKEDLNLHDQSKVVVAALKEYLEKRGISVKEGELNVKFIVEEDVTV